MMTSVKFFATLVVTFCLLLSACSPEKDAATNPELDALEADYREVSAQVSELSEEKDQLEAAIKENEKLLESMDSALKRKAALEEQVLPVRKYLTSLEQAASTVKADIETWRQATRDSYVGMTIPELQTNSGTTHPNVTITEIRDELFVIEDADGKKTDIPFSDVNEAIRKALVHEPTVLSD